MIETLKIRNFKSIKEMQINCGSVTLLVGTNSSGKSSVIQGLLFVAQNMEKPCGLNGDLMSLGSFEENRCVYADEKEITFTIWDGEHKVDIALLRKLGEEPSLRIEGLNQKEWPDRYSGLNYKKRAFQYLSCHRVGPLNVYQKNMSMEDVIGTDGQYAIAFLNKHSIDVLESGLCKGNVDYTLLGQVNWWLSYITDTEISTEEIRGTDLVKASYTMHDARQIRPANIGSGISYLVSILIICLSSPQGAVIALENPEIHLHPSAQAKLCEFFYFISATGRQLFIETHSDHIFNGFRAGIAAEEMEKDKIKIQFISLNREHVSQAMEVQIGRMGRIENQTKDLFDQFDLDLNKMIGLRGKKNGANPK
ncbi:AAA family ATPase [Clostridium sp. MCC353]|uniref:AAA family ATPase n=1 Tax=Clostridium sp. MCC353 TaxID=2592646 RepID=UPI001C020171|nr:AAA family ATPase [Clostridium sp. MCC353]MBT9775976.1 AAA family ATPase [Clostridium sp. MCC353]